MDAVATSNPPLATSNVGPSFITYYPKDELVRYFPKLETVLSGNTSSTWEVIPQVSRELNFTLNVRESNLINPILVQENFKVNTLNNGSGPFIVTSQGVTGTKYKQGDEVMINWNESSSKASAINTQNVKISLSYDGGLTFSYVLAETTDNDGSEKVTLPILANTTSARIKVEPVGNIYYAINKVNFEITNPPFAFNMNTPSLVRCYGEQESKITIDPSGGGGAPYSISWFKNNSTSFQPVVDADSDPKSLIDLGVGLYKVRVTDKDGIVYEEEVTIGGPTNPLVVSNVVTNTKPVLCFGDNTGQIGLQASGGSAPYKYILNGTEVASNRGDSTLDTDSYLISNLTAGSYTIKIIDANNCESKTYSFEIDSPDAIVITETFHKNQSCLDETGSLGVSISGGTAPYTIEWKNEKEEVISTLFELSNLPLGKVSAIVTDSNGCSSGKQVFEIIDERLIILETPDPDDAVCLGKPGYIEVVIAKNNSSTLKFYYNNVEVNALRDTAEFYRIIIDKPVLGAELKIENSFGCSLSYTYQFGIADPKLEILNSAGKIIDFKERNAENEEVTFINKSVGSYIREKLDFGDGSPIVDILRSESSLEKRKHTYTASGVYTSTLIIYNEEGCFVSIKRPVFVGKAYQLKFPNSFSPNLRSDGVPEGDDVNDYFRPIFNGFKSGKMTIYDASGVRLYEESFSNLDFKDTTELTSWKGWNGQNASLSNRNYYCIFEGVTFEDIVINKSANFYLFK